MSGPPWSAFGDAARRHHADARALSELGRHGNADHLAGVAAECGLKAIIVEHLGGVVTPTGKPKHTLAQDKLGHLPDLWDQMPLVARGRNGAQFVELITDENPFSRWDVSERYSDGTHITATRAAEHLASAARIIAIHERATIDGALP
ncbi:hypothetical protein [Saccharothrix coeruleofusca]|uniref:hypothetical protein n=1 Tax=Saccharothrix coeruleofusca TaxID=33919 RepID=UPI0016704CB0|nr:hypothetical protein [Saccharothrix coeruleofusca]